MYIFKEKAAFALPGIRLSGPGLFSISSTPQVLKNGIALRFHLAIMAHSCDRLILHRTAYTCVKTIAIFKEVVAGDRLLY